ncbi:hypothetical protein GWK47_024004 [Chionoecetes opilio]|uniref:Uncharacterized protein n=1 Tax=Chionoecetes opilio TaxID=41210 RepID=A0A8J4XLV1_CHIOP|nr:hypothetical protein GWK47_024004 [Chionoecetes opilio]
MFGGFREKMLPPSGTELVAIQPRPQNIPSHHGRKPGNTHRFLDGAAGPSNSPHPKENPWGSSKNFLGNPKKALARREGVRLNGIPSHVGARGNEAGGSGPKGEPPAGPPRHPFTCLPLTAAPKGAGEAGAPAHPHSQAPTESGGPGKRQVAWYAAATDYHPLGRHSAQKPRADGPLLQCVRLGYCTREGLGRRTLRGKSAIYCEKEPPAPPLWGIPPFCPATAPLRPGPAPAAQPAGGGRGGWA